jgi:hypothetical protein
MDSTKYIGMDVHKETISIAVLNSDLGWLSKWEPSLMYCSPLKLDTSVR